MNQPQRQGPHHAFSGPGPGAPMHHVPGVRAANPKGAWTRLWRYLGDHRLKLSITLAATAASTALSLIAPYLIGRAVDVAVRAASPNSLLRLCALLGAAYLANVLATFVQLWLAADMSQESVRAMRRDLFAKLLVLPIRFFDSRAHGDLMSRSTNDLANVSNGLNQTLAQFLSSAMAIIGCVAIMFWQSPRMAFVTLTVVPATALCARALGRWTRRHFRALQRDLGRVNGFVEERVSGQEIVQLFHQEARVIGEFEALNESLRKTGVRAQSVAGSMGPTMNTLRNLSYMAIALAGGMFASHHLITVGVIASFLSYANQFSQPVNQIANQYNLLQAAFAGVERVSEVLDEPEERDEAGAEALAQPKGRVEFRKVSFSYPNGERVLHEVSLTALPGQMIAIVGHTGSGKTTLVNLLTRFYDPDEGQILIDGADIRRFTRRSLRRQIGMVLQDAQLFTGTVRDNIRFGRPEATDAEVEQAAKRAGVDDVIRRLPQGYDTRLEPNGSNLSHGERQLIAIARTILADPAILVLDEATSSVDTRTEMRVQEALGRLMEGRTSFVIAHRLSTVRKADRIYVMDAGRIAEEGTHEELLRRQGRYFELCRLQWGEANPGA
ncbi:ABC transporter ATP-binding protein [Alicyclobacillus fructus]|uniref:ABC transporter ATP-binding protein n=1 Tax=Alicyclobacillus fructus TaxID=2816082 RepID=UPI001F3946C6|nr:ABC transporter ATP-binding protein [Alicyclobacillus fructus]